MFPAESLTQLLIPEGELESALREMHDTEPMSDAALEATPSRALRFYLLLTRFDGRLSTSRWSPRARFYSRVFWFNRFVAERAASHGEDAGLEQQTLRELELAPDGVDWEAIGHLVDLARHG